MLTRHRLDLPEGTEEIQEEEFRMPGIEAGMPNTIL
jgi:hypothetical protein